MTTQRFLSGVPVAVNGKPYTLLRKIDDAIWQLEEMSTKRIIEHTEIELLGMYGNELTFISQNKTEAEEDKRVQSTLVAKGKTELTEDAKVRYLYAKETLGLPATEAALTPVIDRVWKKLGCPGKRPHFSTICRWRKRFTEGGKSTSRLISQVHKRGNRKPRFPGEVVRITQDAIDHLFLTLERKTIAEVLEQAQLDVIRENKLLPADVQLPLPSQRLVRSLVDSIPAYDRYVARYGRDAANNKYRSVQGHRTTQYPLERAEIDHTRLDMMVVDDQTGLPLGRPWITACIDDYTRCIIGIYVSFADPSYLTVAKCLQHAFRPKTYLKKEQPELVNDWLAYGIMQELVVDNGMEFHSDSLESACLMLGIEIHYSARKTPWFKGKIERVLGSLNRGVAHSNPGTTFGNIFEKGDYDPSKHAVIRLSTLKKAINIWIVDHYHQKPHRALKVSPSCAWENTISIDEIRLPADPKLLDAIGGKAMTRSLSHKGIEYDSLYYNSPELNQLRLRFGDKQEVEIRVNPEEISQIHVISLQDKSVLVVPAIAKEYAKGMSEWQHKLCKKYAATHLYKYDDATVWLEAKEKIRELFGTERRWKKSMEKSMRAAEKKRKQQANAVESEVLHPEQSQPAPVAEDSEKGTDSESPSPIPPQSDPAKPIKRFTPIQQKRSEHSLMNDKDANK